MVMKIVDPMGTEFDSIVSLCSFWGVCVKDFYQGASQGLSMDECLKYALDCVAPTGDTKVDKSKKQVSTGNRVTDHTGQEFPSVNAMCEHWGISANAFDYRFKVKKLSLEKSLTNKLRKRKGVYDHLGREFSTASEMCKYWGVRFTTYKRRLKTGYSLEEALTKGRYEERRVLNTEGQTDTRKEKAVEVSKTSKLKDKNLVKTRNVLDHLGNSYPSVSVMCKVYGVSYITYHNRMKRGWTLEERLLGKESYVEDYIGQKFPSILEMCKFYGVSSSTYLNRLSRGFTMKEALLGNVVDFQGNHFVTVKDMCKHWGINYQSYISRLRNGWSQEEALKIKKRERCHKDHLGNSYPTFKAMCDAYGLPSYLVKHRLDKFKFSLEAALTTPKNKKGVTFKESVERRDGVRFEKRGRFMFQTQMVDDNE